MKGKGRALTRLPAKRLKFQHSRVNFHMGTGVRAGRVLAFHIADPGLIPGFQFAL